MLRLLTLALVVSLEVVPAPAADPAVAPPPRPVLDPLADWTPRPATGQAESWEKKRDPEWDDARFRLMDTGPALNCTMRYPLGKDNEMVYKATVVRLVAKEPGKTEPVVGGVVFDRVTMRIAAGWVGGFLNHSDRRFGLLNTPTPKGEMIFAHPAGPGWADPKGKWDARGPFTRPLPGTGMKYLGMYLQDDRVAFAYSINGRNLYESAVLAPALRGGYDIVRSLHIYEGDGKIAWRPDGPDARPIVIEPEDGPWVLRHPPIKTDLAYDPYGLMLRGAKRPKRWGEPIVTKFVRGVESGPFAVDTLTIPYKNRFNALFFCTGLDHLPNGRIAVCTCHGDVWLVMVDEKAGTCSWQRFATGLYHPLGLKVVDGKVVVLERGQLTRLHDLNSDGEADFHECICNDWDTGPGEHSYDTCLETDAAGNFYFFKTGDTNLPTGGCLMRVSKDGSKAEVFCTGFRHPIGMGMSPTGILTGADQEGNWMPATRIDEYQHGGFYGDMRAHHRKVPPTAYDTPLCWLPREVDNSAGGQVWVPGKLFGPLAGLPIHFSYGRCKAYLLLRQECGNGQKQAGIADLGLRFLSGVCRGRFAADGHLYVCGLNGWQTAALADGCLQRVRYTGQPLDVPVKLEVDGNRIRLTFNRAIQAKPASDAANFKAAWWNYHWSGEYGSKRWKVSDPKAQGQDEFAPRSARLLADGRTVELSFEKLVPVMQMQIGYNFAAMDGKAVTGSVFLTINTTVK